MPAGEGLEEMTVGEHTETMALILPSPWSVTWLTGAGWWLIKHGQDGPKFQTGNSDEAMCFCRGVRAEYDAAKSRRGVQ